MCGILGAVDARGVADLFMEARLEDLRHRGPDGRGFWSEDQVALGHTRLAILDLDPRSDQPMHSRSGNTVLVFNGEIYNFADLGRSLESEGFAARTSGDTEILLETYEREGEGCLERARGMYAAAIWDRRERALHLFRDPIGKKPLYYRTDGTRLVFASELRVLRALGGLRLRRASVADYFEFGYVPEPHTIYEDVKIVPPGAVLTWKDGRVGEPRFHWVAPALDPLPQPRRFEDVVEEADALLEQAVRRRLVSDVPVGAFLSSGVDSALINAMVAQSGAEVVALTVGVDDPAKDETPGATRTAQALGVPHRVETVEVPEANALLDDVLHWFDFPFADSSAVPTLVLCRAARRGATVALGGDGGDEVFGGYKRYEWLRRARDTKRRVGPFSGGIASLAGKFGGSRGPRVAGLLRARTSADAYRLLMRVWHATPIESLLTPEALSSRDEPDWFSTTWRGSEVPDVHSARWFDLRAYLPNDILVKVDRASMANSLEVRAPLLDADLVAWAYRTSLQAPEFFRGKRILREVLRRRLPSYDFDAPKRGFNLPVAAWLAGPLRERLEAAADPDRLRRDGLLRPEAVRGTLRRFQDGDMALASPLWALLMFQEWLRREEAGRSV